jgi:hypothetical protein
VVLKEELVIESFIKEFRVACRFMIKIFSVAAFTFEWRLEIDFEKYRRGMQGSRHMHAHRKVMQTRNEYKIICVNHTKKIRVSEFCLLVDVRYICGDWQREF